MNKPSVNCSASKPVPSQPAKLDTLLVFDRLTNSEIEALRQDKKETHEYCQKLFRETKA